MENKFSIILIILIISSLLIGCLEEEIKVETQFDLMLEVDEENSSIGYVKIPIQKMFDPTILNNKDSMTTFSYKYENTTNFMIMRFNNSVNIKIDKEIDKDEIPISEFPLIDYDGDDFGYQVDEEKLNDESKNKTIDGYYTYVYLNYNNSVIFKYYFYICSYGSSTLEIIKTRIYPGWNKVKCIPDSEQP
ncbi:MAG: hypothetical protein U9R75_12770 [Candidatus Thermoplasmatota archaeon]|nr:hypothetical protein [Candidatus Thermoplasmatota archaeon]